MASGLYLEILTLLHTAISLLAIASGVIFFGALTTHRWPVRVNVLFLVCTILTSATGFLFPPKPIGPPFVFGVLSLLLLAVAVYALSIRHCLGRWRIGYLGTALVAQWLNMIVLIVQSYQKIPALHALAPTGSEPIVLWTQAALAAAVCYIGWSVLRSPRAPSSIGLPTIP